jgi:hypothetical protein
MSGFRGKADAQTDASAGPFVASSGRSAGYLRVTSNGGNRPESAIRRGGGNVRYGFGKRTLPDTS